MIETQHLTKRYGKTVAVDEASFVVQPGRVTGFLGPNGAGKSTTMRMILGLDMPSSGSVLVNGKSYREHNDPLRSVGALLDAKAIDPVQVARKTLERFADWPRLTSMEGRRFEQDAGFFVLENLVIGSPASPVLEKERGSRPLSGQPLALMT